MTYLYPVLLLKSVVKLLEGVGCLLVVANLHKLDSELARWDSFRFEPPSNFDNMFLQIIS